MTRPQMLSALAAIAASVLARPAHAEGLIRFRNVSYATVLVEVRVGDALDTATLYGTQRIAKNETWEIDTAGTAAWWRREASPGTNDGRFTGWQRVDASRSDPRIDI